MKRNFLFLLIIGVISLSAIEFENLGSQIKEINLTNGAKLLLLEDDSAPIVHCATIANVGGVNEVPGITGISHFLEHLAFKGTSTIGTSNYELEKVILAQEDAVFAKLLEAKKAGNEELVTKYKAELDALEIQASKYVVNNEFSSIYTQNGGSNFNAATSQDFTMYQVSLPSNKLELWFTMETERFSDPIFREFYKERQVILDERLMREVNSPQGKLMKKMMNTAFEVHPYKYTTIGEKEDIENITRQDVNDYFNKYYGAQNLTFVLYGDFNEEKVTEFANEYLSRIPAREKSLPLTIEEPQQTAEKRFTVEYDASPILLVSYHIPEASSSDYEAIEALAAILGQGSTSPLIKSLVYEKKLAQYAYAFPGLPGTKYPHLFNIMLAPNSGVDVEDCITELDSVIANFMSQDISEKDVVSYRKRSKKDYLSGLDSGIYLPIQIGLIDCITGDYTDFFTKLDKIDSLKSRDIKEAANQYLIPSNRIIGVLEKAGE